MAMNVHGVLAVHDVLNVLAVHDVLKQGLILLGSLEKSLNVFLVSFFFFFFFCHLHWKLQFLMSKNAKLEDDLLQQVYLTLISFSVGF